MDDFIKVIKRDQEVGIKKRYILVEYIKLPNNYQSKISYDSLIENVILKEIINLMGITK